MNGAVDTVHCRPPVDPDIRQGWHTVWFTLCPLSIGPEQPSLCITHRPQELRRHLRQSPESVPGGRAHQGQGKALGFCGGCDALFGFACLAGRSLKHSPHMQCAHRVPGGKVVE